MSTKKTFVLAIVSLIILTLLAGVIYLLILYNNSKAKADSIEYYYYDVDEMYCNLNNSSRIVKLKITIELVDEKLMEKIEEKTFSIKHEINTIMMNKNEEEIRGKEGLLKLQSEITSKLSDIFNTEKITTVYFEEFIVQ